MDPHAKLHLIGILTFAVVINWLLADRSVMGRDLKLRTSPPWVAMRWSGLGVVAASLFIGFTSDPATTASPATTGGFAGLLILLVGTARIFATAGQHPSARPPRSGRAVINSNNL